MNILVGPQGARPCARAPGPPALVHVPHDPAACSPGGSGIAPTLGIGPPFPCRRLAAPQGALTPCQEPILTLR